MDSPSLEHFLQGLSEIETTARTNIRLKRMGEIDDEAFKDEAMKRFPPEEAVSQGLIACSFWQAQIQDTAWHPLKVVNVEGSEETMQVKN